MWDGGRDVLALPSAAGRARAAVGNSLHPSNRNKSAGSSLRNLASLFPRGVSLSSSFGRAVCEAFSSLCQWEQALPTAPAAF